MKTNYEVTFGYKAVITVNIKAESEDEAKELATKYIGSQKCFGAKSTIQDDNYKANGVLDMDATWNELY